MKHTTSPPRCATWNIHGFPSSPTPSGKEKTRINKIIENLIALLKDHDIILLQETHLNNIDTLRRNLPGSEHMTIHHSGFSNSSSGVTTIFTPKFTKNYHCPEGNALIEKGRIISSHWIPKPNTAGSNIRAHCIITNIYFPTQGGWKAKIDMLEVLLTAHTPKTHYNTTRITGGDWNFIEQREDTSLFTQHYRMITG
jgi:exonuclease III